MKNMRDYNAYICQSIYVMNMRCFNGCEELIILTYDIPASLPLYHSDRLIFFFNPPPPLPLLQSSWIKETTGLRKSQADVLTSNRGGRPGLPPECRLGIKSWAATSLTDYIDSSWGQKSQKKNVNMRLYPEMATTDSMSRSHSMQRIKNACRWELRLYIFFVQISRGTKTTCIEISVLNMSVPTISWKCPVCAKINSQIYPKWVRNLCVQSDEQWLTLISTSRWINTAALSNSVTTAWRGCEPRWAEWPPPSPLHLLWTRLPDRDISSNNHHHAK